MKETAVKLRSVVLNNERTIWIREPAFPATAQNVTIFLDGEFYRDRVGAGRVIDSLAGDIADSWFVFVSMQSFDARWIECPCHRPFAEFLVEELGPWLAQQHAEIGRIQHRVLVGLSYTGLAAAYLAKEFPGAFQQVISQSGSFWWNDCWLVEQFSRLPVRIPTEFYLDVGMREVTGNVRHQEDVLQVVSQIEGVRRFRDALLRLGCAVTYTEFNGGHDFAAWGEALPAALKWALGRREVSQ